MFTMVYLNGVSCYEHSRTIMGRDFMQDALTIIPDAHSYFMCVCYVPNACLSVCLVVMSFNTDVLFNKRLTIIPFINIYCYV